LLSPRCALLALAANLVCGSVWCADAPAPLPSPPPLFVDCRGAPTASPTVILEAGAFGGSADWDMVLADLAQDGRVCAYDRGGTGLSPPRAGGEDVIAIAGELNALLDSMGETRPVILVGHSNGALYIQTFAALWPRRVAGLVYVNGVGSDDLDEPALLHELAQERCLSNLAVIAADLGFAPIIASALVKAIDLHGAAAARKHEALVALPSLRVARDEDRAIMPGLTTARDLGGSLSDIPTVVIVGTTRPNAILSRDWRAAEVAPAQRARTAWVLDAVGASHVSPLGRDRAYVVAAVNWLRSAPRTDLDYSAGLKSRGSAQ
jgi:pimeloyl-ACP methyl ester carboxylesterase